MKKWNTPDVTELNIKDTANGFLKVGWEGPFDVIFGDCGDKNGEKNDSTPDTNTTSGPVNPQ